MIVSISRRTDIPCHYTDWLMNRIDSGYVMTRNPMNRSQIRRIDLSPDNVDCFVFWTKDPNNLIPHLPILDERGYKYYFQFTLTPYDKTIEKNLRNKFDIEDTFIKLSELIGKNRIIWRYDPIIINDILTIEYHKREFERLCKRLSPYTNSVIVSYVDMYTKIKSDIIKPIQNTTELNTFIKSTADKYEIEAKSCCEPIFTPASCIDKNLIESITGKPLPNLKRDKNQRDGCSCYESVDIGVYNTCPNGCVYCYANHSEHSIMNNYNRHDPNGEFLI